MESTTADKSFTGMEVDIVDIDDTPVAVHDCTMQDLSETQERCHNISSFADPRGFLTQIEFRSDSSSSSEGSVNHSISLQDAYQDPFMFTTKTVDLSMLDINTNIEEMSSREIEDPPVDHLVTCAVPDADMDMSIDNLEVSNSSINSFEEIITTSTPNESAEAPATLPAANVSGICAMLGISMTISIPGE